MIKFSVSSKILFERINECSSVPYVFDIHPNSLNSRGEGTMELKNEKGEVMTSLSVESNGGVNYGFNSQDEFYGLLDLLKRMEEQIITISIQRKRILVEGLVQFETL